MRSKIGRPKNRPKITTKRERRGDVIVVEETRLVPAIIDYADVAAGGRVEVEEESETPWDHCDGYEHDVLQRNRAHEVLAGCDDLRQVRGYFCGRYNEAGIIRLTGRCRQKDWEYYRQRGFARQVAAEAIASAVRHTLDQLVKWYEDGWQWYYACCEFEVDGRDYSQGCGMIDDEEYAARDVLPDMIKEVVQALEAEGYTVINQPADSGASQLRSTTHYFGTRADIKEAFQRQLSEQNWQYP